MVTWVSCGVRGSQDFYKVHVLLKEKPVIVIVFMCKHRFPSGPENLNWIQLMMECRVTRKYSWNSKDTSWESSSFTRLNHPCLTSVGRWPSTTAQRNNIYLAGHYSGLHSYQAVERLYWLLSERAYTVTLTLLQYSASVLPVLGHVWPQHKAYRWLIFLRKLKLSK